MAATRFIRLLALFCCAATLAASVDAGVLDPARRMPADVDTFVVIDDAAALRRTDAGNAMLGMAGALFAEGAASKRWAEFSRQLDWSKDAAFKALFGHRVTLVGRRSWDESASWALLCEISRDTERRLRAGLKVAPRKVFEGHTIYAVENGRFELTFEGRGGTTTLLVAPSERLELFNELVPLLRRPPEESLADTVALRRLGRLEGETAAIFTRLPHEKEGWLGARVSRSGERGLTARIVASQVGPAGRRVEWSTDLFDRLAADSALCIIERRISMTDSTSPIPPLIAGMVPWMAPSPELEESLGDLHTFVARPAEKGGLRLAAGVQASDIGAIPAPADRMMRDLAITLSTALGGGAWDFDFGGSFPQADRAAPLLDEGAPLIPGEGLELIWRYAPETEPRGEGRPGWLVMATDRETLRHASNSLAGAARTGDDEVGPWLSVGVVRPAALRDAVAKATHVPEPLDVLGFIEELSWKLRCESDRGVHGLLEVRFAAPVD